VDARTPPTICRLPRFTPSPTFGRSSESPRSTRYPTGVSRNPKGRPKRKGEGLPTRLQIRTLICFGLDPYPVQTNVPNNYDLNIIPLAVQEAEAIGIPQKDLIPVYVPPVSTFEIHQRNSSIRSRKAAMAISSNPLRSTIQSGQTGRVSRTTETLAISVG
jgi:hypothetical protein